jgi:hypothetical protein
VTRVHPGPKNPPVYGDWDTGFLWIERRSAAWPYIQRAAMEAAAMTNSYGFHFGVTYEGIRQSVKVTDEHEMPCAEDCSCCRVIEAHQFQIVERDR